MLFTLTSIGQEVKVDSTSTVKAQKVCIGFYFAITSSFNTGNKINPYWHNDDYTAYTEYYNHKETAGNGFVVGFEIESKEILKNLTFCSGLYLESFRYTGTCEAIQHVLSQTTETYTLEYYYNDDYLNIPVSLRYSIKQNNGRFCILLGPSISYFINEDNSSRYFKEYDETDAQHFGASAIARLDYYFGKDGNIEIGLRGCTQLSNTLYGRRMASVGLKFGLFF